MARPSRSAWIVTAVAIGAVLRATLVPSNAPLDDFLSACVLLCGDKGLADFLVNIVLYAPVGFGFGLLGVRLRTGVLLGFFLSAGVESVQAMLPNRDSSAGDVVANTLGTAVGMLLVLTAPWWLRPARAAAGRLALGWAAAVVALLAATGWLMGPHYPPVEWYGRWTPGERPSQRYEGEVLHASLGPLPLPLGRLAQSDSVRALLRAGARLEVTAVAGRSRGLAPIFALADRRQREILTLGAHRTDLYLVQRTRGKVLRLDAPLIRWRDAFAGITPGDTITVAMWRDPDGICLAVNRAAECGLGFQLGRGWAVFYWLDGGSAPVLTSLDVFWIALLCFPLGLWVSRGRSWALAMGAVIAALIFLPAALRLQGSGLVEFIGLAAGFEVGLLIRRVARTRATTCASTSTASAATT